MLVGLRCRALPAMKNFSSEYFGPTDGHGHQAIGEYGTVLPFLFLSQIQYRFVQLMHYKEGLVFIGTHRDETNMIRSSIQFRNEPLIRWRAIGLNP